MAVCEWCWIRAGYKAIARGIPHGDAYRDVVDEQERLGAAAECPQVTRRSRGEEGSDGATN